MPLAITQVTIDDKPLPITVGNIEHRISIIGYDVITITTTSVHPEFENSCLNKVALRVEATDEHRKIHSYDMYCVSCEYSSDGPISYELQEIK